MAFASGAVLAAGIAAETAVKAGLVPDLLFLLVSPFAHVNPYYQTTPATYLLLTALAAVFTGAGAWALRRRDLPA